MPDCQVIKFQRKLTGTQLSHTLLPLPPERPPKSDQDDHKIMKFYDYIVYSWDGSFPKNGLGNKMSEKGRTWAKKRIWKGELTFAKVSKSKVTKETP